MRRRAELAAVVGLALAGAGAGGCGFTTAAGGHAAAEARVYPAGPRYAEQSHGNGVSVVLEPEVTATSEGGDHRLTLRPFYRVDPVDTGRTHWDLRRADWVGTFGAWELGAGVNVFRWGVLESVPLADAMNPADTIEDLRGTEKLGTPYLEVGWFGGAWAVRAYALPALGLFGGARFVDRGSRLRFGPAIDDAHPIYESALGAWNPSFALRITGTEGDLDVGIGLFSGTSRDPRFVAQLTSDALVPAYDIAHQASLDMQFTAGEVVLKLEAMGRLWSSELHPILSLGLGAEYDLWDVFGSGADLVLALEWLYDRRTVAAPVYVFENDVFVGFRLAFNDSGGTVVKAGVITDLGDGRSYLRGEASRRLGEQLRLALVAHAFVGSEGSRESGVLDDDYVEATLGWYF
ncbi:MAG: hypothetical protein H6745_29275 [Deltaproteobacteria bacterium]|nr:hypothetical protein [Deltaproteobacteria bacterium]